MCKWHHLCFGGGLSRPSAELGSAVPSLVAKSLKSLPFQQQLSRRRSSSDLGRELGGGWNKELSGEGGWGGGERRGEGLVGLEEASPLGDRERQGQKSGRAKGRRGWGRSRAGSTVPG